MVKIYKFAFVVSENLKHEEFNEIEIALSDALIGLGYKTELMELSEADSNPRYCALHQDSNCSCDE